LPISSAAMRPMTSSVSCVSCSTPPPCPSVATSPSTAARGSRKTRRKLIRVLTATMTGPQPSSQRPTTLRAHLGQVTATSAGDQARFSPADGPSSTAKTRDYTQHRGVPSPPAVARRRPPACWSSRKLRRAPIWEAHPQLQVLPRYPTDGPPPHQNHLRVVLPCTSVANRRAAPAPCRRPRRLRAAALWCASGARPVGPHGWLAVTVDPAARGRLGHHPEVVSGWDLAGRASCWPVHPRCSLPGGLTTVFTRGVVAPTGSAGRPGRPSAGRAAGRSL
jgi:hypothetical protein